MSFYWDDVKLAPSGTFVQTAIALLNSMSWGGSEKISWLIAGQNSSHKYSGLSVLELFAAEIWVHPEGWWTYWLNCNLSFFLGITGFAKRTFLYQILMCESEGASLLKRIVWDSELSFLHIWILCRLALYKLNPLVSYML